MSWFADTSFFVAYFSPRETLHELARRYTLEAKEPIVTTQWVLAELGNFLAERSSRTLFASFVRELSIQPRFEIEPADEQTFYDALNLYDQRPDKHWSFVDCTSFLAMKRRRIREALTADHHFDQAGVIVLLK